MEPEAIHGADLVAREIRALKPADRSPA